MELFHTAQRLFVVSSSYNMLRLIALFSLVNLHECTDVCGNTRNPADFHRSLNAINWVGTPYDFNVPKGSTIGYRLGEITARIKNLPHGFISYSSSKDRYDLVDLNRLTGELTLKKQIDDVVKDTGLYEFRVTVCALSSSGSSTVGIRIHVQRDNSLNSTTLRFRRNQYTTSVPENAVIGMVAITVSASDKSTRKGKARLITYTIIRGNDNGRFSIGSRSGNITVNAHLDYEVQTAYNLTVLAQYRGVSGQKSSTAHVYVMVLDVNNNTPVFDQAVYSVRVRENARVGSRLLRVHATDAYSNSSLRYTITGQRHPCAFEVSAKTGDVLINSSLDYEVKTFHNLSLSVYESGVPSRTATATLNVEVVDLNDNSPIFSRKTYYGKVFDLSPNGTVVAMVTATDADSGRNGLIHYKIDPVTDPDEKFGITADGKIVVIVATLFCDDLDQNYTISVAAIDSGIFQRSCQATVVIEVLFNKPLEKSNALTILVSTITDPGTKVGSIAGVDGGYGKSGNTTYSIASDSSNGRFIVDSFSGALIVNDSLNWTAGDTYQLLIDVRDGDTAKWNNTSSITVSVVVYEPVPPQIRNSSLSPVNLPLGKTVALFCEARQYPSQPIIKWSGISSSKQKSVNNFHITNNEKFVNSVNSVATVGKAGTYKCFIPASNEERRIEIAARLTIITPTTTHSNLTTNGSTQLMCEARSFPAQPVITWTLNGSDVSDTYNSSSVLPDNTFTFKSHLTVTVPGVYVCHSKGGPGDQPQQRSFNVETSSFIVETGRIDRAESVAAIPVDTTTSRTILMPGIPSAISDNTRDQVHANLPIGVIGGISSGACLFSVAVTAVIVYMAMARKHRKKKLEREQCVEVYLTDLEPSEPHDLSTQSDHHYEEICTTGADAISSHDEEHPNERYPDATVCENRDAQEMEINPAYEATVQEDPIYMTVH